MARAVVTIILSFLATVVAMAVGALIVALNL